MASIVKEIVDVSIMLEQLYDLIQIHQSHFDEVYNRKVQRTLERLNMEELTDGGQ